MFCSTNYQFNVVPSSRPMARSAWLIRTVGSTSFVSIGTTSRYMIRKTPAEPCRQNTADAAYHLKRADGAGSLWSYRCLGASTPRQRRIILAVCRPQCLDHGWPLRRSFGTDSKPWDFRAGRSANLRRTGALETICPSGCRSRPCRRYRSPCNKAVAQGNPAEDYDLKGGADQCGRERLRR